MDPALFSEMHEAIDKLFAHNAVLEENVKSLQESIFTTIIPQFNEAIVLTDILGVSRNSLFFSINNALVEKIKTEIEVKSDKLNDKRKQKLWSKLMRSGHKYIHHPVMQPLIMHVMGKMNSAKNYVSEILNSKELYDRTPINVLRHVWLDHPVKLKEEIDQVVESYASKVNKIYHCKCEEAILQLVSTRHKLYSSNNFTTKPYIMSNLVDRRTETHIQKIVDMIGDNKLLWEKINKILQEKFVTGQSAASTANLGANSICGIRFDVAIRLSPRLLDTDELHGLIQHLSSCVRERTISNNQALELCKQLQDKQHLSRDLEFLCTDPFVLYTIAMTIISITVDTALTKKKLPRHVPKLTFLSSLMSHGLAEMEAAEDRTTSSLRRAGPSVSSDLLATGPSSAVPSIESRCRSGWSHEEIVETLLVSVLPNMQLSHVSAMREKVVVKRTKVQASMLSRPATLLDSAAAGPVSASVAAAASLSAPAVTKHALVPTLYLSNPLGRLMVQYHCLWCLYKKEFFVLKLLLTAIANSCRADHRPTVEWRPELLQALVLGICSAQSSNEKMMLDFLGILRPAIPLSGHTGGNNNSSILHALLYLLTVAPIRDPAEVQKLIQDLYARIPQSELDLVSTNSGNNRTMKDIIEIVIKGNQTMHPTNGREGGQPLMSPLGGATPSRMSMMSPMPGAMQATSSNPGGSTTPIYHPMMEPRNFFAPQAAGQTTPRQQGPF